MTTVVRTHHERGATHGLTTLVQRFRFEGTDAAAIVDLLLTAPLIGEDSIFGKRPGSVGRRTAATRTLEGFSPAPGFVFDVELSQQEDAVFRVRFAQPQRKVPYLAGDFSWALSDEGSAAVFDEQINTEQAFHVASEPLNGSKPSLRRWLFFRVGHQRVMAGATKNIAALLSS